MDVRSWTQDFRNQESDQNGSQRIRQEDPQQPADQPPLYVRRENRMNDAQEDQGRRQQSQTLENQNGYLFK